jgi:hypothetical protein
MQNSSLTKIVNKSTPRLGDGAKLPLLSQCHWNFETRELTHA